LEQHRHGYIRSERTFRSHAGRRRHRQAGGYPYEKLGERIFRPARNHQGAISLPSHLHGRQAPERLLEINEGVSESQEIRGRHDTDRRSGFTGSL